MIPLDSAQLSLARALGSKAVATAWLGNGPAQPALHSSSGIPDTHAHFDLGSQHCTAVSRLTLQLLQDPFP